jgi:hypothetical protein
LARAIGLDVTDGGVLGLAEGGAILGPSPGYALVDGHEPRFGREALRGARLRPRYVSSDYWHRLDPSPLGPPFAVGLTAADLVHAHLESLWTQAGGGAGEVVLAAPGVYTEKQLGLLLGIAQALDMPVGGIVDCALAVASAGYPGEQLVFVDLGLHRVLVTEVRQGETLARERVAGIDGWGSDEVTDSLARRLAEAFVRATRFDPLHAAETEQVLFDRLPGWIEEVEKRERATVALSVSGREHTLELVRAELESWSKRFVEEIVQQVSLLKRPGRSASVVVSGRAAGLPGLVSRLAAVRGVEVALAPVQAAAAGALRERETIVTPGGALRLVTALPRREMSSDADDAIIRAGRRAPAAAALSARRPSHVLVGAEARAIGPDPLVIGTAPPAGSRGLRLRGDTAGISRSHCRLFDAGGEVVVEDLSTWGTFVNDERVTGRAVVGTGDRVRLGSPGIELLLIAVGAEDGEPRGED